MNERSFVRYRWKRDHVLVDHFGIYWRPMLRNTIRLDELAKLLILELALLKDGRVYRRCNYSVELDDLVDEATKLRLDHEDELDERR